MIRVALAAAVACLCASCARAPAAPAPPAASDPDAGWVSLFDGRTLAGWAISDFGAHGDVDVRDGAIALGMGEACTGVAWTGEPPSGGPRRADLPRADYELALEAQRVAGGDFFCGLTFPVGDGHASLIVGGWGGVVVGLSCINGYDASDNETTRMMRFARGRWYRVRVRVTKEAIEAWIDDERVVNVDTRGKRISVRSDIEASVPLGVASWRTTAWVRNIRLRRIDASDKRE